MRMSYVLCFLLAASAPAAADDIKQEVEKVAAAYTENFNKQDSARIAALYATGGIQVNPMGPRTDISQLYAGMFKTGFNHQEAVIDQAWPLGNEEAIALGEYHITGQKQTGEPLDVAGRWTATYVRDGDNLKIRMLSAMPKAPLPTD